MKKYKWIQVSDHELIIGDGYFYKCAQYQCENCDDVREFVKGTSFFNYCPICGAKMERKQSEK